jgi:FixJ family two-component response regulator
MRGDGHGLVIAIVDDEAALREATESLLKSVGFAAECFASAEEFLHSGCGGRARCVVLDVRLPGMSGLDLQRHLAALDLRLPVIFLTGQEDANGEVEALALGAGACAFLRKPFGSRDLVGAIRVGLRAYTKVQ